MIMKQLFRHTTSLLRTALLLGAATLFNILPTQAMTEAELKEMLNAFETKTPTIDDGQYYYIQYYYDGKISYLTDRGADKFASTADFMPSNNRLWTLVSNGVDGQFWLKSKNGNYIGFARFETTINGNTVNGSRYGSVANTTDTRIASFKLNTSGDGYNISDVNNIYPTTTSTGLLGRPGNNEWSIPLSIERDNLSGQQNSRMHFVQLKSNTAFIIYYRQEGVENSNPNANATRHYLTYSGTDDARLDGTQYWWHSEVSSQKSIIPSDKPLSTLPTVSAYHKDGLWTLEKADVEGQFYIKRYEDGKYLNKHYHDGNYDCALEDTPSDTYTLETPDANRYTRVQNVTYTTTTLTSDMFYEWNGAGASAGKTSESPTSVAFNVNNGTQLGGGTTVVGTDEVAYLKYADLSEYQKMTINGTSGMQLRVLMSRQESDNGPLVEKNVTIGSDGKAVVDLTNLELNYAKGNATVKATYINGYVNGSDDFRNNYYGEISQWNPVYCGDNKISGGNVDLYNNTWLNDTYIAYLQVDASAISGNITKVTLTGEFRKISTNGRQMEYGVGYNNSTWSDGLTWNTADRSITTLGDTHKFASEDGEETWSFDITDAFASEKIKTILVYNLTAGNGYIKNPRVEVEYSPNIPVSFAHLNAIKRPWDGNTGTVSSIELSKMDEKDDNTTLYLHHGGDDAGADGWQALQWPENNARGGHWYAGFYPVEVPNPNQDNYYRVLAGFNDGYGADGQMLTEAGWLANYSDEDGKRQLLILSQEDDYQHFYLKTPSGQYIRPTGGTTDNKNEGERLTNTSLYEKFFLKWYYVDPNAVEIHIDVRDRKVTHKESYLRGYVTESGKSQGLIGDADSDWMKNGQQMVNEFKITHYVKRGNTREMVLPTTLRSNNDHVFYQRWYIGNDEENITSLLDRVSLKVGNNDVAYYIYKNGLVTGEKLFWNIPTINNVSRYAQYRFTYTNTDGAEVEFPVTADVSRYSDLEYEDTEQPLNGDLVEPSLTMRYIYSMNDAKTMAKKLMWYNSQNTNKWMEDKDIHFPVKRLSYETAKNEAYQGDFLSLRHLFRDYWIFDDPQFVTYDSDGNPTVDYAYIQNNYNTEITTNYGAVTQETMDKFLDDHLVSTVTGEDVGRIRIVLDNNNAGLSLGGHKNNNVAQGFYLYDEVYNKRQYGDSRFLVFNYPSSGEVTIPSDQREVRSELKAYFDYEYNGTTYSYQLCRYTIIFAKLSDKTIDNQTKPWREVKGTNRDPNKIRDIAGHPIAKVTFDYPDRSATSETPDPDKNFYHTPTSGLTKHNNNPSLEPNTSIDNSSPIPMPFAKTNYAFDGENCSWGSYALASQGQTPYGYNNIVYPANTRVKDDSDQTTPVGYAIAPDKGMQDGFMYIDASEMPGDICSVSFQGDFCSSDVLMCSGWISGANQQNWPTENYTGDKRCPGGITLTMKGENDDGSTETIYRYCPGQCYEVTSPYVKITDILDEDNQVIGQNTTNYVEWQQFYFEFSTDKKYKRYWMEVNNNCVSSNGGDFMLDNIEVYTIVPEVKPDINTPLCVSLDDEGKPVTEMRLLKLKINYNKLVSSRKFETSGDKIGTAEEGFVFLDKNMFLKTFKTGLKSLTQAEKENLGLADFDFNNITPDELANAIEDGSLSSINMSTLSETHNAYIAYKNAFDAAILGNKTTWHSDNPSNYMKSSIMYFRWSSTFENDEYQPVYSFADAVNKKHAVYREVEVVDGDEVKYIVMNGNFPGLNWKTNTDYYVVNTNQTYDSGKPFTAFNLCSECTKASVFRIEPPYTVLGLEKSEGTDDYVVCEGQIPTVALNLKGYDLNGNPVDMKDLNFDWWLGNNTASTAAGKLATLENYHKQHKEITYEDAEGSHTVDVKLDAALAALRSYYPTITSLDGVIEHLNQTPNLSKAQVLYLQEVVKDGQLVLHQSSISVPAEKNSDDDPYFYLVACPIHDAAFNQALNPQDHQYVGYFCDEPQGLRIKVGQKAPTLKTGFVPGEHGFNTYDYAFPAGTNPVLSIRLAKAAQFETVKNSVAEVANVKNEDTGEVTYNHSVAVNYLWLPIRNAMTQTADGVIKKAMDDNIYLASTNDPTWDKKISKEMSKFGSLPVIGRIVQLTAKNTSGQSEVDLKTNTTLQKDNRLCVYFTKDFNVREGYNYTLSLPFQEQGDVNTCDGTILINLKIVPDYEVWTGGAGNTDWNNDENWRRADGNTTISNDYYGDELYRANGAVNDPNSPLHDYTTNKANYYSSSNKENAKPSSDQILRKGFAPLYCTHIMMKNDEWGNAPVLYDAIDGNENGLTAKPFPNLRDTSTPILKFDMQARRYDMWEETYGESSDRGESSRPYDLIAEMYQINSCDEIAMQPGTELLNAHLMNYNSAWMEYELDTKRWYLLGSPLQGTISGEWYAPTGTAQQKTTYYDNVTFGTGYDRYSPAIYQRSWDKAKAVLYEVGADYATTDDSQTENLGNSWEGSWNNDTWKDPTGETDGTGADDYLDRLGYKPFGAKKANVAIKGIWSNTYNDAQVDYAKGGFSVMVMNHLKGNDQSGNKAIIRLPKEDTMYDYYKFSETGAADGGTDTNLTGEQGVQKKGRALNRGRLKTDLLLPEIKDNQEKLIIQKTEKTASRYGDQRSYTRIPIKEADLNTMNGGTFLFTENVAAGASNLGYYLVENPFPCGLDMNAFFAANTGLQAKYWILTKGDGGNPRQQLVQQAGGEWVTSDGTNYGTAIDYTDPDDNTQTLKFYTNAVVAPGQGFFVQATTPGESTTITFNKAMQVQSRFGVIDGEGRTFKVVVGQSQEMRKLRKLVDKDGDGIPETESLETDNLGFETIEVDLDGDGIYGETGETEFVMVPVYETDGNGNYVLDGDGNKIPILDDIEEDVTIYKYKQETLNGTHNKEYPLRTRGEGVEAIQPGLVITAKRDNNETCALVMQRKGASNDFLPSEDTEAFITSDFENVPTVYTLCGRLATTINSIHDFRSLPIGVESTSNAPCTLTFRGVEMLGDSIAFYDAVKQELTPLESGMAFKVSGQTQNRYYLVRGLNQKEAAEETHLQIFTEGLTAKVIASTAEPIVLVRCFDTAGRLIYSAEPQTSEYSFTLPRTGIYIIEAETENDHKTMKVIVKQ